ncbi:MAG: hypothetical protein JF570_13385, partial [Caulobacter sp.]|nr:hypothetical protein [Caulobacter sp.]
MGMGSAAFADCLPNPPVASTPVTCTGPTVGGLTISSYTTVNIGSGASLTADVGDAAAFTTTSTSGAFYATTAFLNVDGVVDGASASGVLVSSGPTAAYPGTQLYIKVGQGGTIEGATAVQVVGTPGNTYGRASASLDNSGVVQSTSGSALVAANPSLTGFTTVNNRVGGYIGGINGVVENLTNAGTIDGGTDSAYTYASTNNFGFFPYSITNSGVMRSNGAGATIDLPTGATITNSGQITNSGTGLAIGSGRGLNLQND